MSTTKIIDISLRIEKSDGDPSIVSKLLNFEPTRSLKKSDRIFTKAGKPLGLSSKTLWVVDREYLEDIELEEALAKFLTEISLDSKKISQVRSAGYDKIEVFIGLFGFYEAHDFWLGKNNLTILCKLGVDLGFSYYCIPEE